ncbi:MAG: nucleotide exchange factor GrpE [Candidatus Thiodiazotropha sp.]|nr:nucleotide exchange factor GrpE [Candidatus Thiodiazotropha taylori]MBT3058527.1 nucleotide exchange factor GrpE [Candidatus Thiodiazotropha sp. (ex Lucina pensylvanica)]MBV2094113.1 nucleotide exchange factor GrpE [Candidatus Thiodiazotropha sp. (ex Codakia orbicularis)]PUB75561.1 MAG: nucleotide exchange factor GrpE [gamma proteobacterium symbiont of Ctena orbiculata]MBT3063443.1 nucleotide exchange factor GrpE [Candidatus Thiodiazotropha sp. (ex Lucina pensylvanica)]
MSEKDQAQNQTEPVDEADADEIESGGEAEVEEATESAQQDGQELTKLLEDARAKADDHWDQLMRTRAELENIRKRNQRDLENAHKFALEKFSMDLLQVWDSLELGHQAAQDEQVDVDKLREGTELTLKLLVDVMQKHGIEQVNPDGEAFNPEFHQAMSMQERDDVAPNTVVAVMQKGYLLNSRLLRPAMVMVSRAGSGAAIDEEA